ncbi:MAG: DNA glycosylase AlkZ-like family protein [Actinomycetes bacterium]
MDLTGRLRAWTHHRQRLGASAAVTPGEALRAVVGVYSAHPTAPLALAARARRMSAAAFRALESERLALRIPAMRGSIFLVPRDTAPRLFLPWVDLPALVGKRLARWDLSAQDYSRIKSAMLGAAAEPAPSSALGAAAGLPGPMLATLLRCLRHEGVLLPIGGGSLRAEQFRYAASSSWAPEYATAARAAPAAADEVVADALRWLAGEYLRAFGPARVADFAWWAGLRRRTAQTAVASLDTVDVGDGLLLPACDLAAFEAVVPLRGEVDLLPKWDSYTMGLAPDGRTRLVHPDVQPRVYSTGGGGTLPGDGFPVVLVDGQAVGTWRLTQKDGASVELFDSVGAGTRASIEARLREVGALLDA